ncbi:hypothetical protein ACEWY4_015258 [Coilia grayii]|uniref:Uncharacterized protein n=1 Tax=Coilia grayii TaxID=363190 RepID=A0ABD1JNG6_9TELE
MWWWKCGWVHVVWAGDFNAHSTLWGGKSTDNNGRIIEDLLSERNLVCLNDGRGTRLDVRTGRESREFRKLRRTHNFQHFIEYKQAQAVVRRVITQRKRTYWREYCSSIGSSLDINEVWGMIKKMEGNRRGWDYPILSSGGLLAVSDKEKAEIMVGTLNKVHSTDNLSQEERRSREETMRRFGNVIQKKEKQVDTYNVPFTMLELRNALESCRNSAPGKDEICYSMLSHLSDNGLLTVLNLFNRVWEEGRLPAGWKEAVIVPIKKPGKDASNPANYRPIALTSPLGKLMERLVSGRLMYFVEEKGLLARCQSGFRKGRNTIDSVVCLEHEIRKAQIHKETLVAVFLDVEKAYDMLWVEGLLIKMHLLGIGGNIFNWVLDVLSIRSIQVRIGKVFSGCYVVENGTPQGSVISPLLFNIMIKDIFSNLRPDIGQSLFADDGGLWKRGKNVKHTVRRMQEALERVEGWGKEWGFRFSVEKTKTVFFTRRKVCDSLKLYMYKRPVERVSCFKFLGVSFDSRLTWRVHVSRVVDKCKNVLNLMRCLAGKDWVADLASLKMIYVSLIRARIDYGCLVYTSAAASVLAQLDVVQAAALRLCAGAVRTSPVCSLQVVTGEMPLGLRRKQLQANYWVNLMGQRPDHPVREVIGPSWEREVANTASFGWTGESVARDLDIFHLHFCPGALWPVIPVWQLDVPDIDLLLLQLKEKDPEVELVYSFYCHVEDRYGDCILIFTDGSKDQDTGVTGAAFLVQGMNVQDLKRTSDQLSVFTVELYAILMAVQWTGQLQGQKVLICSDSVSALKSLGKGISRARQDLVYEILLALKDVERRGVQVSFLWVPAHEGIRMNERVDKLAKKATERESVDVDLSLSKSEGKSIVWQRCLLKWQQLWEQDSKGGHLFSIYSKVTDSGNVCLSGKRKEGVILTRLKIGHTCLNGTLFIMGKHQDGLCSCQQVETVHHVLLSCRQYDSHRQILIRNLKRCGMTEVSLKSVMNVGMSAKGKPYLLKFLLDTGLYNRI